MKHTRFTKSLVVLAVALVWAALPVLAADTAKTDEKPGLCMMKGLNLSAEQQAKIMDLCKSHREAVRALLNDEQKKKFDAMAGCMHGAMMMKHECGAMAGCMHGAMMMKHECGAMAKACSAECKCPCMKDGKCACVKKDGKCACPATCACMKDGKCTCTCAAGACKHEAAAKGECAMHAKKEAEAKALPCAKTCATPCTKKEKQE